ncbi:MAG: SPFH domain-containing protein [Oscillospiraceae bacterium]|nr:SPFH domain-containing protein [Oscillospiraceae bacterium]
MGLIQAAVSSVSGALADSWLEVVQPAKMGVSTVAVKGYPVNTKKNKRSENIISNGSVIQVAEKQAMLLLDGGQIVDYSAYPGYYKVFASSTPSIFNGQLADSVKDSFNRFRFNGIPSASQEVMFLNLQELRGIRFGTRNALQYFDNFYQAELFVRCHGTYSIRITDPVLFYQEVLPKGAEHIDIVDVNEQFLNEFLCALQTAFGKLSEEGVRISSLGSKSMELSKQMADVLDADWRAQRGFEIVSVAIANISYDEESKKLINMRNQGAMMQDPNIRNAYVQSAAAQGLQAAGSNPAGAGTAFMGMGAGMAAMSGIFQNTQPAQQPVQQQPAAPAANNGWQCSCGMSNVGNFCANCGAKRPAANGPWQCGCGMTNQGNFCANCGKPRG